MKRATSTLRPTSLFIHSVCGRDLFTRSTSFHIRGVELIEEPGTLGHEDFDGLCDQNIRRQHSRRLHGD